MEVQRLVQVADASDQDIIEFPFHLEHFYTVLRRLFSEGLCLQVTCLTTVMICHMSSKHTFILQGQAVSLAGDLTDALQKECFKRMATYFEPLQKIVRAEFPSFDVMSAYFKVFSLQVLAKSQQMLQTGERKKALQRLAKVIGVTPEALEQEFFQHEAFAQKLCRVEGLSSFEAWRKIILKRKQQPPALMAVLARCGACCLVQRGRARLYSAAKASKADGKSQDEHVALELDSLGAGCASQAHSSNGKSFDFRS